MNNETKAIYVRVTAEQHEWLRRYSYEREISQAEIIRQALERFRTEQPEAEES